MSSRFRQPGSRTVSLNHAALHSRSAKRVITGGLTVTECIDCGLCGSVCPVAAIHADDRLPEKERRFAKVNADFFGPAVTGWGSPGGADDRHVSTQDHPVVTAWPRGSGKPG
jgi:ferredoxin